MTTPTHRDIWYTAVCCLWSTAVAFLLGWILILAGKQNSFSYFCINSAIDVGTIFAITRVYVPFLTRGMSIVLVGAIFLNLVGWLDFQFTGYSKWFDSGMTVIAALQVLMFIGTDLGLRHMDPRATSFFDWLRSRVPKSNK